LRGKDGDFWGGMEIDVEDVRISDVRIFRWENICLDVAKVAIHP
jgi:hypothetical protein